MSKLKLPVPKFFTYTFVKRGFRYGVFFGLGMIFLVAVIPYFPDQLKFFDFTEGKRWLLLLILGFVAASLKALADFGIPMTCEGWCLPTTLAGAAITATTLAAECILVGFLAASAQWIFVKIVKMRTK